MNSEKHRFLRRAGGLLLGLLTVFLAMGFSSCRIGRNVERFDPLIPEMSGADGLVFQGVVAESALPAGALKPEAGAVRIGPGDVLDIEIVETPNTRATVLVMPDGMLHYDLAGGIQAKALTLPQLERKLAERHHPGRRSCRGLT